MTPIKNDDGENIRKSEYCKELSSERNPKIALEIEIINNDALEVKYEYPESIQSLESRHDNDDDPDDVDFIPDDQSSVSETESKEENKVIVTNDDDQENDDEIILKYFSLDCKKCGKPFPKFHNLSSHFRKVHKSKIIVECCSQTFHTKTDALRHAYTHYDPEKLKCIHCNKFFKSRTLLFQHKQSSSCFLENKKQYQCTFCPETFSKAKLLKKHKLTHPDTQKYICPECNKHFRNKASLSVHTKMVHERKYEQICDICAKIFTSPSSLQSHYKSAHQYNIDEAVECQVCGSILKDKYNHRRHMLRQHTDSPGTCEICGKECPNTNALRMHKKRTHFDEAKYICSVCNKGFKREHMLKEHMATHTGEVSEKFCDLFYIIQLFTYFLYLGFIQMLILSFDV